MQSRGAIFLFCEVFGQFSLSYIHNLDYMYVGTEVEGIQFLFSIEYLVFYLTFLYNYFF